MDKKLREAISETILRCAVIENHNREMAAIPPNEELAKIYEFSERHEARMKKIFAKERRREVRVKIYITCKKISFIIMVAIVMFFGASLTKPNFRAAVRQTTIEWYSQFTRFSFNETGETGVADKLEEWYPAYLPNGFEESSVSNIGGVMSRIEFTNESGEYISLEYSFAEGFSIGVDNEHSDFKNILYDGVEYYVFSSESDEYSKKIIWYEDNYRFYLLSMINIDEMLKMAASVAKK
jgi:hypothetical protein